MNMLIERKVGRWGGGMSCRVFPDWHHPFHKLYFIRFTGVVCKCFPGPASEMKLVWWRMKVSLAPTYDCWWKCTAVLREVCSKQLQYKMWMNFFKVPSNMCCKPLIYESTTEIKNWSVEYIKAFLPYFFGHFWYMGKNYTTSIIHLRVWYHPHYFLDVIRTKPRHALKDCIDHIIDSVEHSKTVRPCHFNWYCGGIVGLSIPLEGSFNDSSISFDNCPHIILEWV